VPLARIRPVDRRQEWQPRRSVRLFLDDIDEMVALLAQVGEVTALTSDFGGPLTNAKDLSVLGGKATRQIVTISTGNADRSIKVGAAGFAYVEQTPRDDLELSGAVQRIREVFDRRQRRFGGFGLEAADWAALSIAVAALPLVAVGVGSALKATQASRLTSALVITGVSILLLAALVLATMFGSTKHPRATLVLAFEADAPGWWRANRKAVLLSLVTNAAVGAVFFVLGLWLAN
jgi:hypothetical protein